MVSIIHKRKEAAYFKVIAQILGEEITNANISFATVTDVKLSKDYSILKVFVTFEKNIKKSLITLNTTKVKGFIKTRLSSAIQQRKTPSIIFQYDKTFEEAQKIEKILEKINKKQ